MGKIDFDLVYAHHNFIVKMIWPLKITFFLFYLFNSISTKLATNYQQEMSEIRSNTSEILTAIAGYESFISYSNSSYNQQDSLNDFAKKSLKRVQQLENTDILADLVLHNQEN